jgi:hypothetical protein
MLLLAGAIRAVGTSSLSVAPGWQSPNLWWPDDQAWCVGTEIDLMSTYVGGSRGCVRAIVEHRQLEAAAVESSDGVQSGRQQPIVAVVGRGGHLGEAAGRRGGPTGFEDRWRQGRYGTSR